MAGNLSVRRKRNSISQQVMQGAIFVLIISLTLIYLSRASTTPVQSLYYQPVMVQSGDTLWQLADQTGLPDDTRTLVRQIIKYNGLADSTIHPGQTIYLPISLTSASSNNTRSSFTR